MSFQRYPQYKASAAAGLGNMPSDWSAGRYRWIAAVRKGRLPPDLLATPTSALDVPYLTMEYLRGAPEATQFVVPTTETVLATDADVLLVWDGSNAGEFLPAKPGAVSSTVALVRARGVHARFLFYASKSIEPQVRAHTVGMGIPHVSSEQLLNSRIAIPPVNTQSLIAMFLDRETAKIDALAAEQERLIKLLAEKRQAIISNAVTKGTNPDVRLKDSGSNWLGELPAHWDCAQLVRTADRVVVGIAEAATHAYVDDGVPILRSTNIRAGAIEGELLRIDPEFAERRDSKTMRANDLVTVRTGNAGVTAVVPATLDGCQCFTMLITTLRPQFSPAFYCHWMNSIGARSYFEVEGWGTAQVNISVPILKALPVPIPPYDEQLGIVASLQRALSQIDALANEAQNAINVLHERRSALISSAVTGQIDVRNAIPAEVA